MRGVLHSLLFLSIICFVTWCTLGTQMGTHGATLEMLCNMTPVDAISHLHNTPIDQSEEEFDKESSVIVFYKFSCSDCTEAYDDILEAANGADIIWVSTATPEGKALANEHNVTWVPSVYDCSEDRLVECLEEDENGETTINEEARRILQKASERQASGA